MNDDSPKPSAKATGSRRGKRSTENSSSDERPDHRAPSPPRPAHAAWPAFRAAMLSGIASGDLDGLGVAPSTFEEELATTFTLVLERAPGGSSVRVRPALADSALVVVEITNDDMPFLVDSVMGELQARGIEARLVLHPIVNSKRTANGSLEALGLRSRSTAPPAGMSQESCMLIFAGRMDPVAQEELRTGLEQVLVDVRRVVDDWPAMRSRLRSAIDELQCHDQTGANATCAEAIDFLEWIAGHNFTLLGMRDLTFVGKPANGELRPNPESGLGLLRDERVEVLRRGRELVSMTPEVRAFFFSPDPLIVTKANVFSRVHRRVHMDYIGVKRFDRDGRPTGELRIVGLFTSQAYTRQPREIPLLKRKVAGVISRAGLGPDSHAGKALANVLDTFPRDELFQIPGEMLQAWAMRITDLELRPRTTVLARIDPFDRFVSVLSYLPRDRFNTQVRLRIGEHLAKSYDGRIVAFYPSFSEASLVRAHFIVSREDGPTPEVDTKLLEKQIDELMLTWDDRLARLFAVAGEATHRAAQPTVEVARQRWAGAFSAGYAETFPPERALEDIARIDTLTEARPAAIDFHLVGAEDGALSAAIYRMGGPIPLSERVPLLENMGFRVIDERSFEITPSHAGRPRRVALHDMRLELPTNAAWGHAADRHLEECFLAVLDGRAENDGYNRLVLASGIDWRQTAMLRAYGAYLRQIGLPFGPRYLSDVLVRHRAIVGDLVALFACRFDPALVAEERGRRETETRRRIDAALADVPSLEDDRVLRHFANLVMATKRTNFFQRSDTGEWPPTIACKLASGEVDGAPLPRPFREIWVSSPRVEGVHLRFAPIARGGLRWSDRPLDFRTEVLGLAKAQQVKNSVIVPAGAKGGFVPRLLPIGGPREAIAKEGLEAYRIFVSTLLDLTDNLVEGKLVPPRDVVRHDGDDPYLVVAADKGTATFSDHANALATARGFWLGDAFASGGSAGYDHKGMGITARGAWVCIARHFREMGRDIASEPFTCVGVGDMSGDVFGNGMLLSPHTRLVAAFDHRDIFLDPDPDPATSQAERMRLFGLPRSSWQDYDRAKLSVGGGVFPRTSRSIALSPQVRQRLGLSTPTIAPNDLVRAVLGADVDLLYFGGIGTYVRATSETNEAVGDRANDAVRVTAEEVRARVVGEGANLGFTQAARIELARRGGRIDTDFIDNSAGVNTSDQEVNIKIALAPLVRSGVLDVQARKDLLASFTDEVAASVLRNNYLQSLALSIGERRGMLDLGFQQRLMRSLESDGQLDRALEGLPSDAQIAERRRSGQSLTRPELSVLLSYSKIALQKDLLDGELTDDPSLQSIAVDYMPASLRERHGDTIRAHPLRREIIAATLANRLINRGGSTMLVRTAEETGRTAEEITRAFLAVIRIFNLEALWARIDALDGRVDGATQLDLYVAVQELIRERTVWMLRDGEMQSDLGAIVAANRASVQAIGPVLEQVATPEQMVERDAKAAAFTARGIPAEVAADVVALPSIAEATDVALVAKSSGAPLELAATAHARIGQALQSSALRSRGRALPVSDPFDRLAINSALATLGDVQRRLAVRALAADGGAPRDAVEWLASQGPDVARAARLLAEIAAGGELTVSRLTVAASQLQALAGR